MDITKIGHAISGIIPKAPAGASEGIPLTDQPNDALQGLQGDVAQFAGSAQRYAGYAGQIELPDDHPLVNGGL